MERQRGETACQRLLRKTVRTHWNWVWQHHEQGCSLPDCWQTSTNTLQSCVQRVGFPCHVMDVKLLLLQKRKGKAQDSLQESLCTDWPSPITFLQSIFRQECFSVLPQVPYFQTPFRPSPTAEITRSLPILYMQNKSETQPNVLPYENATNHYNCNIFL